MFARAGEMFELAISVAPDDWRILHMFANTLVAQALHLRHCATRAEKKYNSAAADVDKRYRAEMSLGGDEDGWRGSMEEDALLQVTQAAALTAGGDGGGGRPGSPTLGGGSKRDLRRRGSSMLTTPALRAARYPIAKMHAQYQALFTKARRSLLRLRNT